MAHDFFAVDRAAREQREARADAFLEVRVQAIEFAILENHAHLAALDLPAAEPLRLADLGPVVLVLAFDDRQLHVEKRQLRAEVAPPFRHEHRQQVAILVAPRGIDVALALIKNDPLEREWHDGPEHRLVEAGRALKVFTPHWLLRRRPGFPATFFSLFPRVVVRAVFGQLPLIGRLAAVACHNGVVARDDRFCFRIGEERLAAHPIFGERPAPGADYDADGNLQVTLKITAKKIGGRGNVLDRRWT